MNASTTDKNTTPTPPNADVQNNTAHTIQRHQQEFKIIFNLLEKLLHPESTKRCTPQTALFHPMLAEPATAAPLPPLSGAWAEKIRQGKIRVGDDAYVPHAPGKGVCEDWHFRDDVTELECVRIIRKCLCLRRGNSVSEDGSEEDQEENNWCGQYVDEIVELSPGEGIAIGDRPCEFHGEDVYATMYE
jgi:cell division control protein 7